MPEIRRLLEGQRVHTEIQQKLRQASGKNDPSTSSTSASDLGGKAFPRASDRQKLREFDRRVSEEK